MECWAIAYRTFTESGGYPGYYWGKAYGGSANGQPLVCLEGEPAGPFKTVGEAALDMARSMIEGSAKRGVTN